MENSLATIQSYKAQGGLTIFEPPCIGHVWLLPEDAEKRSSMSLNSYKFGANVGHVDHTHDQ